MKKMLTCKKAALLIVYLMAFLFMFWGSWPSTADAEKPVKLGLLSPFSPPGDPAAGKRMRWGAELAVEYINTKMGGLLGGRPVELVVEDDSGTPADGIAGFRKLVQKDNVSAVVGQYHSSVCLAVNKVSQDLQVPLFSTGASSPKITDSHNPYIFSIMSLTPDRAKFWVDFGQKMKFKRIAALAEDTDYGTGFEKYLIEYCQDAGIELKSIIFPRTITDMTPLLLETKAWKPDLIINVGVGAAAYLMVKQAYDIGLFPKAKMIASYSWPVRPEYWDAVGEKGKYIMFTSYYKPGMLMSDSGNWMSAKYKEAHNEDPTFYSLNAFGQLLVVAQAINKAQSDDPKALQKALVGNPYQDWSGTVTFKDSEGLKWHNVAPPHLILQETEVRQPFAESKLVWPPQFGGDGKIEGP
jgi:branched-chain amino acid transport system substrate-binding protein